MSRKECYFKCDNKGVLYSFPPVTYNSYEKYLKWKTVLKKEDQGMDDHFIIANIKLCKNHFESFYFTQVNRLTRHAIPTLNIVTDLSPEQEELLCTLIEENPVVINGCNEIDDLKTIETIWKEWAPRLNAYGPHKSYDAWPKYLFEVMSKLKTKKVKWIDEPESGMQVVSNNRDFTNLELKILEQSSETSASPCSSPHNDMETGFKEQYEIDMEDNRGLKEHKIDMKDNRGLKEEYKIDMKDTRDSETFNDIVTVTLNVETDGPLLQVASTEPSKAGHRHPTKSCNNCNDEEQDRFDLFGKDIAQQLREMPLETALETKRLLISVLRGKQARLLNNTFL